MFRLSLLRLWCLIIAIAFAANTARGQQVSKEEQEVLNASAARREAYNHRDLVALNRYISDDGLVSTDDGALVTKADLMRHLKDLPPHYEQISNAREFAVRLHGSAAVISFRSTTREQFGDSDIVTEQRRTETWSRMGHGSWLGCRPAISRRISASRSLLIRGTTRIMSGNTNGVRVRSMSSS